MYLVLNTVCIGSKSYCIKEEDKLIEQMFTSDEEESSGGEDEELKMDEDKPVKVSGV